jgi:hypothetical protein
MGRSGVLSVGDAVALGNVQSAVLARVVVSSDSDGKELKLLRLALLNEIWEVATVVVDLAAGAKWPLTRGCVCQ